jgi:hypothetical protein
MHLNDLPLTSPVLFDMLCAMQTRLDADIEHKQQLKQRVEQQLQQDMQRFKDMEREAAALISKARHANSKLMVGSCCCCGCCCGLAAGCHAVTQNVCRSCLLTMLPWLCCVTSQAKTAQAALQEARGFTATIPTTELIKSKKPGPAGSSRSRQ